MTDRRPSVENTRQIETEMRTTASPESVWASWADPKRLAEWFADDARGEVRPGGTYTWIFESFGMEMPYQVVDVVEGKRLLLGPVPGAPPFALEVTIEHGGGQTVVRLVNSGFDAGANWDEEYDGIASGWDMALGILRHYVERYFGTPRSSFLVMKPARFQYEHAVRFFTDPSRLEGWLGTTARPIGNVGETVRIDMHGGGSLTGRVLVVTKRELAISWQEVNGVLELKAFPAGPAGRMLGLRGCGWGLSGDQARSIEHHLDTALERLVERISA
jgi:uncharacterized protein YndB with AHSA1/START domain